MLKRCVAVICLSASGCQTFNQELLDAQLPETPSTWAATDSAAGVPTGDWVAAFNDDLLKGLIKEAIESNNSLLAAGANLEQARQNAKASRASLLPTLNASQNNNRSAIVTNPATVAQAGAAGAPISSQRVYVNNFSLGAQAQWELDLWGRLNDEYKASRRDAYASFADLEAARLSIAGSVSQAWFALIEARLQRELAERDVTARESNLRVTSRRYERGVASSLDVRLSQSQVGSSRATLASRQQAEKEAGRALEVLLGRYPHAEIEAASALPSLPGLSGAGAPSDLLTRRPDLIAAELRMEASGFRARAARKQLLPQITLSSQINTSGPDFSDLVDPQRLAGNIAAGIFQPMFQGGRLLANSKAARATAEANLFNYAQTVLEAFQEAENAIAAEEFLASQEAALKMAFEEAAAAEKLTQRRYANGAASIFNLLDAQTRRISNESAYITAQRQRVGNRVALYLAIGGDFLTEIDLAMADVDKKVAAADVEDQSAE